MEKPLTSTMRPGGSPMDANEYVRSGGYSGTRKALREMTPRGIIDLVKASNLLGRGGAGFPTGLKWSLVPADQDENWQSYLICNADEMEPGTFKDKYLLEEAPHQLIDGMIIAAYAVRASKAYIFLRWAYKRAEVNLRKAIAEAYGAGFLGKNILGTGYDLDILVHTSAGRYMCGEESALMNSLEGKRAIPRTKPPFPTVCGLFGKPTVINNVETLSCVPHIILNGAEWFKGLSITGTGGTKLYGVSGRVKNPGLWELPLGVTMRELIMEHAGGMADGFRIRGIIPGGASTDFVLEEHLDARMDFQDMVKYGSRLGTGTMMILDDKTCPVAALANIERFFALESCGWCTPCREGLSWTHKLLAAIEEGNGKMEYLEILDFLPWYYGPGNTFCAHAPGAAEPLQSGLKYFRDDFVKHINDHKCPWR